MCGLIVVRAGRVTEGTTDARIAGNTGASAWPGERPMPICCRLARFVVLFADSSAFASAHSGTRS
jgi:hypothetical protein